MSLKKDEPSFQIKGSVFTLTVLHLLSGDMEALTVQLAQLIEKNPGFFQNIPIIVDLQKVVALPEIDFVRLAKILRKENFIPIAIRGGSEVQQKQAVLANWALLNRATKIRDEPEQVAPALTPTPHQESFAQIVTQPVRSGQRIYAQGKDLIIVSSVSPGAEIIADGHIHVYGALKGRALAGVNGNKEARIFCYRLEAELVSIAGHFWVNEESKKNPASKGTQVYLQDEHLRIVAL